MTEHKEIRKVALGTFLAVQWLRLYLPMQWVQVQSMARELRSHMPRDVALKKKTNKKKKQRKMALSEFCGL